MSSIASEDAMLLSERVDFSGQTGRIEGVLTYSTCVQPIASVLLAGPHPMLGGDLNNNVVRGVSTVLAKAGLVCLSFNYRGVGASEGRRLRSCDNIREFWQKSRTPDEAGYLQDTLCAAEFLKSSFGSVDHLTGYSFGAWIVSQVAKESAGLSSLSLIAPTVEQHDYSALATLAIPKLVICSVDDFAVSRESLERAFCEWAEPRQLHFMEADNHFFRGFESQLSRLILDFLMGES